jgi:hypothetical protein
MLTEITNELMNCAAKLQTHYSHYQNNQSALRRQVVEPVLTVLGWDLANPSDVQIDGILTGTTIDYLKYGDILDGEKVFMRKVIQAIVRVIRPDADVAEATLVAATQTLLVDHQIPACIITNGTNWHFIAVTKEKKRLNQVSAVQNATDWLIYFARPNITYVRISLTLHMKAAAFITANALLRTLLNDVKYGKTDTHFWSIVSRIQQDFVATIRKDFPYFDELTPVNTFFEKHLATMIDKGVDASALRVVFTQGQHKGKILFSETAKWVFIQTIKTLGLERVRDLHINAFQGKTTIGNDLRHICLVEGVAISKIPQDEAIENGKLYFIAHQLNNEQKVTLLKQLDARISGDGFGVETWKL